MKKINKIIMVLSVFILLFLVFLFVRSRINLFKPIEACYSPDGINITEKNIVGNNWGGTSGIKLDYGKILLGGLDFSDRSGIEDKQNGNRIKDVGLLISNDGWKFSKFKPEITNLDKTITTCGDPTLVELPDGDYRMYFTDGETGCHGKSAPLLSAYSKNGTNYSYEGKVTGAKGISLEAVDFTVLYEKYSNKYFVYTRSENPDEADVLESNDGRYFDKRIKIKLPFGFQFSIIDEGDFYTAYGSHIPQDNKPNSNLRYPVRATSKDGLNWERTREQPSGPWIKDRTYCGTAAVVKLPNGYYFY